MSVGQSSGSVGTFNGATAFQRWKPLNRETCILIGSALQWSHRLSAMETAAHPLRQGPKPAPSMEPPPFSDGNTLRDVQPLVVNVSLQWSHRLSAMETTLEDSVGYHIWVLQWSHRLSAMETPRIFLPELAHLQPFNGATAFQRWKRLFVARLRHGFMQKRAFSQESVTG